MQEKKHMHVWKESFLFVCLFVCFVVLFCFACLFVCLFVCFFSMVNMVSVMDRGRVHLTTENNNNVEQHGGNTPANTTSCCLGLLLTFMTLDTHVMINW